MLGLLSVIATVSIHALPADRAYTSLSSLRLSLEFLILSMMLLFLGHLVLHPVDVFLLDERVVLEHPLEVLVDIQLRAILHGHL